MVTALSRLMTYQWYPTRFRQRDVQGLVQGEGVLGHFRVVPLSRIFVSAENDWSVLSDSLSARDIHRHDARCIMMYGHSARILTGETQRLTATPAGRPDWAQIHLESLSGGWNYAGG